MDTLNAKTLLVEMDPVKSERSRLSADQDDAPLDVEVCTRALKSCKSLGQW